MSKQNTLPKFIAGGVTAGLLVGVGCYLLLAYFRPSDPTLMRGVNLDAMTWLMRDVGAKDADYDVQLGSCDAGPGKECRHVILTGRLSGARINPGDMPAAVNGWNAAHAIGRVYLDGGGMVLSQEIDITGGVSATNLKTQITAWFRALGELKATFGP